MERLAFDLPSTGAPAPTRPPVVVGVVASGNLEVLVEPGGPAGACHVEVATSANGFGEIWAAVLQDFAARHAVAGLALSVNDGGATPAVVTLRLAQAVEEYLATP
jgi:malonate decarboxylase delta subunit